MAAGGNIQLWCLSVNLDNWKWHDSRCKMSDRELTFTSGECRVINILSPLISLAYVNKNAVFYYDQMQVEKHATPAGLGMVDKEILIIWDFPRYLNEGTEFWEFKKRVIELSSREEREGRRLIMLNFPLEKVEHSHTCKSGGFAGACSAVLKTRDHERAATWATLMLQSGAIDPGPKCDPCAIYSELCDLKESWSLGLGKSYSYCQLAIAIAKLKIANGDLKTTCDVFSVLLPWVDFCKAEHCHEPVKYHSCREMVPICSVFVHSLPDIKTPGTCYRRLVSRSSMPGLKLAKMWDYLPTFYVGPVRSSIPKDQSSKVPTFCLHPNTQEASVYELVLAWRHYAEEEARKLHPGLPPYTKRHDDLYRKNGLQHLIEPHHLTYNGKKVGGIPGNQTPGASYPKVLIADVIDNLASKHYFVIAGKKPWGDNRDLDQLTEFIEGGGPEKKEKAKRKKTNKKGNGSRGNSEEKMRTPEDTKAETDLRGTDAKGVISDQKPMLREASASPCLDPSSQIQGGQNSETQEEFRREADSTREGQSFYEIKLGIKEAELKDLLDKDISLVEWTGKKMSSLISAVDRNEDKKHSMQKEVTNLEVQMSGLREQLEKMEAKRGQLLHDIETENDLLNANLHRKKEHEDYVTQKIGENRKARLTLEQDIDSFKMKIEKGTKSKEAVKHSMNEIRPDVQKFLDNINNKIEAKERDLECPICMEVCTAPIFCCDEQHIICSSCRPQVTENYHED